MLSETLLHGSPRTKWLAQQETGTLAIPVQLWKEQSTIFAKIALKEWYFLSKHVSLWNISADICQDRNWIVFLAVDDSNFVKQDCLFPCPNCPTLPRCLDENGTQPTSDSGAWVGASLANEHVVSITMGLLAGWVARCQALNVEGVTCVRSTISWYNCVSQTALRIHWDSTKQEGQGWGSEQPCRGPVHSERGLGGRRGLGYFPVSGSWCAGSWNQRLWEPEDRERVTVYWYSHYTDKMDPITWW